MKKAIILAAFAAIAISGCVNENEKRTAEPQGVPVSVNAAVTHVGSKAAVNAGDPFTAQVIASPNSENYTIIYSSGNPLTEFDQTVNFTSTGQTTIDPVQYYPINGGPIFIRGFAPIPVSRVGSTASYIIDGTQDIMVSNEATGDNDATTARTLTFQHLLTQLKFVVVALDAEAQAVWGDITGIDILEQTTALDLNLNNGALNPNRDPQNGTITAASSAVALTTTPTDAGQVMFYPMILRAATPLKLNIRTSTVTSGRELSIGTVVGGNILAAGTAYTFILTFNKTDIFITAALTDWATITWNSVMGN